jgi:predicted  nucleic acid-binding Zn-ribbon protein
MMKESLNHLINSIQHNYDLLQLKHSSLEQQLRERKEEMKNLRKEKSSISSLLEEKSLQYRELQSNLLQVGEERDAIHNEYDNQLEEYQSSKQDSFLFNQNI